MVMLTIILIEYSLLLSQMSLYRFIQILMKCVRYVGGILNFTISKSSADFAALSAYTNTAWNPAEVDYFILNARIITVQYIQDIWRSIFILWRDCKQESESEKNVKCLLLYFDI